MYLASLYNDFYLHYYSRSYIYPWIHPVNSMSALLKLTWRNIYMKKHIHRYQDNIDILTDSTIFNQKCRGATSPPRHRFCLWFVYRIAILRVFTEINSFSPYCRTSTTLRWRRDFFLKNVINRPSLIWLTPNSRIHFFVGGGRVNPSLHRGRVPEDQKSSSVFILKQPKFTNLESHWQINVASC